MVERVKSLPDAPWVEVYKDFYVLEIKHGCLVKVGGANKADCVSFVPGATIDSFKEK